MSATEKRIELVRLLQKLKQSDEKPGDTILRVLRKEPVRGYSYPRAPGIGRVADDERALVIYFDRRPTDDEMRDVHDIVRLYETGRDGTHNGGV